MGVGPQCYNFSTMCSTFAGKTIDLILFVNHVECSAVENMFEISLDSMPSVFPLL